MSPRMRSGARGSRGRVWTPPQRGCARPYGSLPTGPERPIPRRWCVVAHLFSGPRRSQDVQDLVQQLVHSRGMAVVAVSVDVLCGDAGDLTEPARLGQWRAWCRDGVVAAFVACPPCNTWCRARAWSGDGPLDRSAR